MPKQKNLDTVVQLTDLFKESVLIVAAQYSGLDVGEMHQLRAAILNSDSRFRIAKNTLSKIAADGAGRSELKGIIDGPTGFLTTKSDPASAAKAFVNHITAAKVDVKILGGILEDQTLSAERVLFLAKLPPREELIAKMLGSMNSPISGLVTVMNGPIRAFATILTRISEKITSEDALVNE